MGECKTTVDRLLPRIGSTPGLLFIAAVVCLSFSIFSPTRAHSSGAQHRWRQASYLDFAEGVLLDGGTNDYVGADGSVRLINQWDLNGDGNIDIILPSQHDNNMAPNSFIYWGDKGFDLTSRTVLPGDGAQGAAIADINGDGIPDIVIANAFNGTKTELHSFVYWGSRQGYSASNRIELPTVNANAAAVADLNHDGHMDIVFASGGYSYQFTREGDETFLRPYSDIYWGSSAGFSSHNTSHLETFDATNVRIADLDHDGIPEIIFAMRGVNGQNGGVFIYWGSKQGKYSSERRTYLPGDGTRALEVADLNHDGFPDLILANDGKSRLLGASPAGYPVPSYIYWGSSDGYSITRRAELPTEGATDVKAGDLNGDGVPDIVIANKVGEASFIYWGTSGSPGAYSPYRRTELPTLHASHCAIADLNGDGLLDLVFSNSDDGKTFDVNSYIYWNSKDGFDPSRRLELPTLGATDVEVGRLGGDEHSDILFVNSMDGTAGQPTDTYVYWGNASGSYSPSARLTLPISYASSALSADLNRDGYPDLIIAADGGVRILWGSAAGYSLQNSEVLPGHKLFFVNVADFNRDGYLDLSVSDLAKPSSESRLVVYWGGPNGFSPANQWSTSFPGIRGNTVADLDGNGYPDLIVMGVEDKAVIFWNGPGGFDRMRSTVLPTKMSITAAVADLNRDGYLDIVIPNLCDPGKVTSSKEPTELSGQASTAAFQADTYIYWGGPKGYLAQNRQVLSTIGGEDVTIADLNKDGHLDLVVTSYHAGNVRNPPSYIFWGSEKGFSSANETLLPTESASMASIADFNNDGWLDILFANHSNGADHKTDSYIYWGGKDGFSTERRLLIPSVGVHGMMRPDVGNIRDRHDGFDYVSAPYCSRTGVQFQRIAWQLGTSDDSAVKFQVRFGHTRESLAKSEWQGPTGVDTFYANSQSDLNPPPNGRCVQYKATLSSSGGKKSPVLKEVIIDYVDSAE